MKIEVLGTGCHNCLELQLRLGEAVAASGRQDIEVEYVDDEHRIRHYMPLEEVPGLVIDGHLVSEREVPSLERLIAWLKPESV